MKLRRGTKARRWGWVLAAGSLVLAAVSAALTIAAHGSEALPEQFREDAAEATLYALAFCAVPVIGALIVAARPRHPIGWIFLIGSLGQWLSLFAQQYALWGLYVEPGSLPLPEAAAWAFNALAAPAVLLTLSLPLLLFPTGHLPSRRWRPLLWLLLASVTASTLSLALKPGPLADFDTVENPVGVDGTAWLGAGWLFIAPCVFGAFASLVVRYRRAGGDERQQLKWLAAAACVLGLSFAADTVLYSLDLDEYAPGIALALPVLVAAVGVAILKYRLYDLDLLVNRTAVYGVLTGLVAAGYVGIVAGLGEILDSSGLGIALLATAVVAVAIQPLRAIVQRRVNRFMYGDREEPYRALARLGERLEQAMDPDAVLPAIVESVAEGLRLPYVAIELAQEGGGRVAASHGDPRGTLRESLPLEYRGERVGRLIVERRSDSEPLAQADRRLLADLARQAGVAAHAVALTQDLRRSRERLVAAREEERRRLRRDLHDGLGPTLAGVSLEIESARSLVDADPAAARRLLADLTTQVQGAIADVRRIAYELRPPALDQLGLVGAIKEHANRLGAAGNGVSTEEGLHVSVHSPERLPTLPAAVEVAAYRIALEALTNAARHASARRCTVRVAVNGDLDLEVRDDGRGIPARQASGVGLTSMRERAEELGGRLTVTTPADGGTLVAARLPVAAVNGEGSS